MTTRCRSPRQTWCANSAPSNSASACCHRRHCRSTGSGSPQSGPGLPNASVNSQATIGTIASAKPRWCPPMKAGPPDALPPRRARRLPRLAGTRRGRVLHPRPRADRGGTGRPPAGGGRVRPSAVGGAAGAAQLHRWQLRPRDVGRLPYRERLTGRGRSSGSTSPTRPAPPLSTVPACW